MKRQKTLAILGVIVASSIFGIGCAKSNADSYNGSSSYGSSSYYNEDGYNYGQPLNPQGPDALQKGPGYRGGSYGYQDQGYQGPDALQKGPGYRGGSYGYQDQGAPVGRCPGSYAPGRYGQGAPYGSDDASAYPPRSPRDRDLRAIHRDNRDNRYNKDNGNNGNNGNNRGSFFGNGRNNGNSKYNKDAGYNKDTGTNRGYFFGTDKNVQDESHPNGSYGPNGSHETKKFNPANIERIKGEIIDKKITRNPDGSSAVIVILRTKDNKDLKILLGPSQYLEQNRLALQLGDKIEVKVSRMSVNGDEMLIAYEIDKNGIFIKLRDDQGKPAWQQPTTNPGYNWNTRPGSQGWRY